MTEEERQAYIKEWAIQVKTLDQLVESDEDLIKAIIAIAADTLKVARQLQD